MKDTDYIALYNTGQKVVNATGERMLKFNRRLTFPEFFFLNIPRTYKTLKGIGYKVLQLREKK
jgi:hypothetical protein